MKQTADTYRLSRIQAEGWNAARAQSSGSPADFDETAAEALCPYRSDPEKSRWLTGFCSAFKARLSVPGKLSGGSTPVGARTILHPRDT